MKSLKTKNKAFYVWQCAFPYLIIFGSLTFTILTTLIGYQYQEESRVYVVYNVSISLFGYIYYAWHVLTRGRISKASLKVITGIFIVVFLYVLENTVGHGSSRASDFFKYMLVWSVPACLYGMLFFENNILEEVWYVADVFMMLITIVVCINGAFYYINGRGSTSVSGSTTYQTMSYLSALAAGLNYYLLVDKNNQYRPSFFQTSLSYKIICLMLLPVQVLALILTGGRGGMILVSVYILVITCTEGHNINKTIKRIVIFCIIIALITLFSSNNESVVAGLNRIFSFVGNDGINWEETSGRDQLYANAINLIKERPLFGYGIWGLFNYIPNPHNIFLEWMLGGGIIGMLIGSGILLLTIRKYYILYKINSRVTLLLLFFLYNFVMLMFSGTYLCAPTLWFFIGALSATKISTLSSMPV